VMHSTGLTPRETKLMKEVAEKFKRPLVDLLADEINKNGLSRTAELLEISKATLGYWCLKLSIKVLRIALKPGQQFQIIETK